MKQQYDSYKPSGIDWIGDIPSHWDVCRFQYALSNIKDGTHFSPEPCEDGYPYITAADVRGIGLDYDVAKKISKTDYESLVKSGCKAYKDDVLLVKDGATTGRVGYKNDNVDCVTLSSVAMLRGSKMVNNKYLMHYISGNYLQHQILVAMAGAAMPRITLEKIKAFLGIFPPLAEQEAIAAWLDEKCGEIDAAIAKVDREIELIDELKQSEISRVVTRGLNPDAPLSPSGIDWIGDVPEHWIIAPFKRSLKINNGCDYKHIVSEEGYPVIGSGGQFAFASDYLYDGEVLLLGRKGTIDKPMHYIGKFWTVDTMFYAIPNNNVCCKYMYYQALGFPFDYYSTATALPSMAASDLANNPVIVPPLSEQKAIADYLDKKCAKIDGLKAKLSKKRETLTELRQSIISEVVTGKRKVI